MKHIVGFSGGIDSQACALWVRRRHPREDVILLNNDPGGNEHPLTTEFVRRYSETVFPVVVVKPTVADFREMETDRGAKSQRPRDTFAATDDLTFDRLAEIMGRFPGRINQFCTLALKMYPMRRWVRENVDPGEGVETYSGVRRDESKKRATLAESDWNELLDCPLHRPLIDWSKAQAFAYVAEAGEETNPLYRLGFGRVGCAPCVNSNKEDIRLWAARAPEMIDKVRAWEDRTGKPFFPPKVPGGHFALIDEIVNWSRTARGGKQLSLPTVEAEAEAGTCSSKYGLCE